MPKNSLNLATGEFDISADASFGGKTIEELVGEVLPNMDEALGTALEAYDQSLNQASLVAKLQTEDDKGLYLGEDGLLHLLPDRVVTNGMNIPAAYIPTTIVDGAVTSYVQVRIENGIIYPPIEISETDGEEEENGDD